MLGSALQVAIGSPLIATTTAIGMYGSYSMYKDTLGPAGSLMFGALQMRLGFGAGLALYAATEGTYSAMKYGHQEYRRRRQLNFGNGNQDWYGHGATMRQRSVQLMGRGRQSIGREARMFHF